MSDVEIEYEELVKLLTKTEGVTASQMFGKPCLKINGKAFVARHLKAIVFQTEIASARESFRLERRYVMGPFGQRQANEGMGSNPRHRK